ncbi:hypothetical protein [Haloarcula rubripromontorii]|uniref:hypothetical protein n=1 Tax=Haloarcula rubripromontorii TaxID=1705562 RepID=UPI0006B58B46|nr:hypothetical protein [Haloarcula rubripromontorii]
MAIVSKVISLDPKRSQDIKPTSGGIEITSIVTENDIGVKFINHQGDETEVGLKGGSELDTSILIDSETYIAVESTHNSDERSAFLSMEK